MDIILPQNKTRFFESAPPPVSSLYNLSPYDFSTTTVLHPSKKEFLSFFFQHFFWLQHYHIEMEQSKGAKGK